MSVVEPERKDKQNYMSRKMQHRVLNHMFVQGIHYRVGLERVTSVC